MITGLSEAELKICRMLGIDPAAFAKTKGEAAPGGPEVTPRPEKQSAVLAPAPGQVYHALQQKPSDTTVLLDGIIGLKPLW